MINNMDNNNNNKASDLYLRVNPDVMQLPTEANVKGAWWLENISNHRLAIKIRCSDVQSYKVSPVYGLL